MASASTAFCRAASTLAAQRAAGRYQVAEAPGPELGLNRALPLEEDRRPCRAQHLFGRCTLLDRQLEILQLHRLPMHHHEQAPGIGSAAHQIVEQPVGFLDAAAEHAIGKLVRRGARVIAADRLDILES